MYLLPENKMNSSADKCQSFLIVSCFRNAAAFIQESVDYTLQQHYDNFRAVFVDDASTDDSVELLDDAVQRNPNSRCNRIFIEKNHTRKGMLWNTHHAILRYASHDDIVVIVDGDDRLLHRDVLTYVDAFYRSQQCWVMYGGAHWNPPGSRTFLSSEYSAEEICQLRISLDAPFHLLVSKWRVHHLRSFLASLYFEIGRRDPDWLCLKESNGQFFSMAADVAIMRPLLELAGADRVRHNAIPIYVYNLHEFNDHVIDREQQWECVRRIFAKPAFAMIASLPTTNASPVQQNIGRKSAGLGKVASANEFLELELQEETVEHSKNEVLVSGTESALVLHKFVGRGLFSCSVAVEGRATHPQQSLTFLVHSDGELVAYAPNVRVGELPRTLVATISNATTLKLSIESCDGFQLRGKWIRPVLESSPGGMRLADSLFRAEIGIPHPVERIENCIATIANPAHGKMLEALLSSVRANGDCDDARFCIVAVDDDGTIQDIANRFSAVVIPCSPFLKMDPTIKSVLYSIGSLIRACRYICLDADMVVHGSLKPMFQAMDVLPQDSLLVVRESNSDKFVDLRDAMIEVYRGQYGDMERLVPDFEGAAHSKLVVNDGMFGGQRSAMLLVDSYIRGRSSVRDWVFERSEVTWRNQFAFNLVVARFGNGVRISDEFNIQLHHFQDVHPEQLKLQGLHGFPASIIHYNGDSRRLHPANH